MATFQALTADQAYTPKGMFFSEVYLFTKLCREHGVTHVIESGVRNGGSTRLLRAVWGADHVVSIELKAARVPDDLKACVRVGDGRELVPALAAASTDTLGVLLDGPKGSKAYAVRDTLLAESPHVLVIGIHDCPAGHGETMHTTDPTFRREVGDALDASIPLAFRSRYPLGCPGLGLWVR